MEAAKSLVTPTNSFQLIKSQSLSYYQEKTNQQLSQCTLVNNAQSTPRKAVNLEHIIIAHLFYHVLPFRYFPKLSNSKVKYD